MATLDPRRTALVLIDLQKGIVAMPVQPYSGPQILERCVELAGKFRDAGALVVRVHVGWSADGADALKQPTDAGFHGPLPADFDAFMPDIVDDRDVVIRKRQWGAFHGTELDLQLRRRGIEHIVLAGIATNIGVESTARSAWEHGYQLTVLEDACSTFSAEMQDFAFKTIFPRLGHVTTRDEIVLG
ncbi:hydrolase [Solimonas marina]|uniref:Hydrolase n=1 Tax=Solimonas marina TaxID=2714601 RepID=A0A969W8M3_9GAMM|nr:hydrolase [Solimonas marina]NKF22003.1 hydrolase [Solimonas marina]